MSKLAFFIEMEAWPCLMVGGNEIACDRAKNLLAAGAKLTCWSDNFVPEFISLAKQYGESVSLIRGNMTEAMLEHMLKSKNAPRLVILASEDMALNKALFLLCENHSVLANLAGTSGRLDFAHSIERGALQFGLSGEEAPELVNRLASKFARELPESWRDGSIAYSAWRKATKEQGRHPEIFADEAHEVCAGMLENEGNFKSAKLRAERRLGREI